MSISLTKSPASLVPVYNPFYYVGLSSNINQANFKYLVNIYSGTTTGGTVLAQYKIYPQPLTGELIFSPNRLLESYVSYDIFYWSGTSQSSLAFKPPYVVDDIQATNHQMTYTVGFGEEYGPDASSLSAFTNLTTATKTVFNGVLQFLDKNSWEPNIGFVTQSFLTDAPSIQYLKFSDGANAIQGLGSMASLTYIAPIYSSSLSPKEVRVRTYTATTTGTSSTLHVWRLAQGVLSANTRPYNINHIGSGPTNINQYSMTKLSGASGTVIWPNTTAYDIWLANASGVAVTGTISYHVDANCYKFDGKRLMWLNSKGGWDYYNFMLVSKKTLTSNKKTFEKPLSPNYGFADRGTTVLNSENRESRTVTSDWIDEETYSWLVNSLMSSNEVYEILGDDSLALDGSSNADIPIPIKINDTSKEYLQKKVKKMFNITFDYDYAFEYYRQRG